MSIFGGFGSNNNNQQQQGNAFGGFGQNNNANTSGGFGSANNTGFGGGNNNAGGSLFGGTPSNTGFGQSGFGTNNQTSTGFGSDRPAFGAAGTTSGGSLFGGSTATASSGFGGLGNNNASTGFGTTTGTGTTSLFGSTPKPAFGSGGGPGGGLFGAANTNTGFGNNNTSTGFGSSSNTGFGSSQAQNQAQNQGTGSTPFQPHTEADGTGGGKAHYQSIVFQQPYQNFSFEELRQVDYNQGRKYGNQSGQAGAFGTSTGFGGFGSNNTNTGFGTNNTTAGGGLFGTQNNTNTNTGFGTNNNNAFGTTSAGFNSPKLNLFGNTPTTTTTQTGGGIFGTSNNNTTQTSFGNTGFGSNSAGGLFGNNNAANTQNKPTFGFGNNSSNASTGFGTSNTGGGFGTTNTAGSLFGNNANTTTNANPFGTAQTNTGSAFGGFGQNAANQTTNTNNAGGLGTGFGTNAQNQAKPSLFGNTTGGASLFGNNTLQQPQQQTSGLFGNLNNASNNQQSGGLFGNKPAATGNNLFGNTQNNTTSGGLFNLGNQNQQPQGSTLFGQNQNQPKPGGLFGSSLTTNNNNSGVGLFGNLGQSTNNQTAGNSLFSNNANQQSQSTSNLFASQQNQSQQAQAQQLMTSIGATNPYGNEHLFVSLATPTQSVGPLATPLSSSQKPRKPAPLQSWRLNPASSSRLVTPQKRSGYGFAYSSYGTPGSATSNASPSPFSSGLLGSGHMGRSLNKSYSTNNLRSTMNGGDSILSPGAFSPGSIRTYNGSGSMKKLNINRNLRTNELFGNDSQEDSFRPSPLKKKVSFETDSARLENSKNARDKASGETSTALVRTEDRDSATPQAEEQGFLRSSSSSTSPHTNGVSQPEMEEVKGNELAIVPEDGPAPVAPKRVTRSAAENARLSQTDIPPGAYYTIPPLPELRKMSRTRLSHVEPFTVGREGSGHIEFGKVNLNEVDLDKICGDIVQITTRTATVYLDNASKPPNGKGLNVPAIVTLGNSWPRAKGGRLPVYEKKGPRFEKHILRLKRVAGTEFINYDELTGEWTFRVEHFSTYALDYKEDEDSFMSSVLTPPPDTSPPKPSAFHSHDLPLDDDMSAVNSNIDDTFEFRTKKSFPGAFDSDGVSEEDAGMHSAYSQGSASVRSTTDRSSGDRDDAASVNSMQIAGSFPNLDGNVDFLSGSPRKSILRQQTQHFRTLGWSSPRQNNISTDDWANQLQRTVSPKKQNRQMLRELQDSTRREEPMDQNGPIAFDKSTNPFATSIDVMNSLFGYEGGKSIGGGKKQTVAGKGSQWPSSHRSNTHDTFVDETEQAFHESLRPSWCLDGTIAYAANRNTGDLRGGIVTSVRQPLELDDKTIRFASFSGSEEELSPLFRKQRQLTNIELEDGVPRAFMQAQFAFSAFAALVDGKDPRSRHEKLMWQLASILFDEDGIEGEEIAPDDERVQELLHQAGLSIKTNDKRVSEMLRRAELSRFWKTLVSDAAEKHASQASSAEEKAIAYLSGHRVPDACKALLDGRDIRLATQIPFIGGDDKTKVRMKEQIDEWRRTDVLSEMTAPIRTLYELLAGNTCVSDGKSGAGPENRAESFKISSRFGLDWRRSFGLRLWYGSNVDNAINDAVLAYEEDQENGDEEVKPIPWFIEQDVDMGWEDDQAFDRRDVLWGLLKIYNGQRSSLDPEERVVKLQDIISPHNLTGNPMDNRVSFQLYHFLAARKISNFSKDIRDQKADQLASDYAFQLASAGYLVPAIFASLYITDPAGRRNAIKSLLSRCAALSDMEELETLTKSFIADFKIPEEWLWEAKAPYIKSVDRDDVALVQCLLRAGDAEQAHQVLKQTVAPRAIIEEDLPGLKALLENWSYDLRSHAVLPGWGYGGAMYLDYIRVVELSRRGSADLESVVKILPRLVPGLASKGSNDLGLDERVAVTEMSKTVLDIVTRLEHELGMEIVEEDMLRQLVLEKDGAERFVVKSSREYHAIMMAAA